MHRAHSHTPAALSVLKSRELAVLWQNRVKRTDSNPRKLKLSELGHASLNKHCA